MSITIKANQGNVIVGEFDSDGETELRIISDGSFEVWSSVYLDRRRAELLIEAIKKQHNL